jgi:hypothetical protein
LIDRNAARYAAEELHHLAVAGRDYRGVARCMDVEGLVRAEKATFRVGIAQCGARDTFDRDDQALGDQRVVDERIRKGRQRKQRGQDDADAVLSQSWTMTTNPGAASVDNRIASQLVRCRQP